jgi:hypothetical protein
MLDRSVASPYREQGSGTAQRPQLLLFKVKSLCNHLHSLDWIRLLLPRLALQVASAPSLFCKELYYIQRGTLLRLLQIAVDTPPLLPDPHITWNKSLTII